MKLGTPEVAAGETVDIFRIGTVDHFVYVKRTAEMNIEGIPLKRPVYIVVTAASHVADAYDILGEMGQARNREERED